MFIPSLLPSFLLTVTACLPDCCRTGPLLQIPSGASAQFKTASYTNVASGARDEDAMGAYVSTTGPLSVVVDASEWSTYTGGVLSSCGTDLDHAVQAVGIDTDEATWKVSQSFRHSVRPSVRQCVGRCTGW